MRVAGALLLIGGTLPPVTFAGGTTHIAVPECGIDGDAEVLAVGPCPPVQKCPPGYATVTATFRHVVTGVWDVAVEGEADPLGVTGNHPVWSEDRRAFVRADGLSVGERLLNADGEAVRVTAVSPRGPPAGDAAAGGTAVFNVEVHGAHVYRVGGGGLLVHNGSEALRCSLGGAGYFGLAGDQAHHIVSTRSGGAISEVSRRILRKHGIGIDNFRNGVYLPSSRKTSITRGFIHESVHTLDYHRYVARQLTNADIVGGRTGVLLELQKLRRGLIDGTLPPLLGRPYR